MKRVSKLLALSLVSMFLLSSCDASSSSGGTSNAPSTGNTSGGKLSFRATTVNFGDSVTNTPIQKEWLKQMSAKMGKELDIKFEYINVGDYTEKLKVIVAGGDIPDLLTFGWLPIGDLNAYGDKGVFAELDSILDKLPNYKSTIDKDKNAKKRIYTPDGKLYAFFNGNYMPTVSTTIVNSAAVKTSVLKENNLEIPTTLNEMYEVAKVLKEKGVSKFPIIQNEEWQNPEGAIFAAYHTASDRFFNGKEYQFGPLMDDYKEALQYLNKIYTEGLISPDYFTHKVDNGNAALADGSACIIPSVWNGYPTNWKTEYPEDEWVLVPLLASDKYPDEPWIFRDEFPSEWSFTSGYSVVVSAKSKVLDDVLRFMDFQYDNDIVQLMNWGIEGEHFKINDQGKKEFLLLGDENKLALKASGLPVSGSCRAGIFPQVQDIDFWRIETNMPGPIYYKGKLVEEKLVPFAAANITPQTTHPAQYTPIFTLSTAENEAYANIMTPVTTFAKEEKVKFIKGQRPFSDWPKYIEELNKMGDIQKAMDIYNSKIK